MELTGLTYEAPLLSAYSILKFAVAVWLFSRTLPARGSMVRQVGAAIAVLGFAVVSYLGGFSIFPALTSDLSLVLAVLSFVAELALGVAVQCFVFDCPLLTSVFCCSMAYSLENLSSAADRVFSTFFPFAQTPPPVFEATVRGAGITLLVYLVAYFALVKRVETSGLLKIKDPVMVLVAACAVVFNMVLDLVIKDISVPEIGVPLYDTYTLSVVYLLVCVYVMYSMFEIVYNRRLQMDMAAVERMRAAEARQYEMRRESIEAINLKAHDLKHQIRQLAAGAAAVDERVLDNLSREVDVYDCVVKSGNDALNTILTEKSLYCEKRGITLSCIADGTALGFMAPADLYSFFGNALDNAIEAVERLNDAERRSIGLVVRRQGDMALIHVENYFDGELCLGPDGLPRTSKGDKANHGYGTRSMRMIVEAAGGTMTCRAAGDIFCLDVMVPIPA